MASNRLNPKGGVKMGVRMFYVHNGSYVQHQGSLESCQTYIRNVRDLHGITGLTIVVRKGNGYVPYNG